MSGNEIVAVVGIAVLGFWMLGAHNRLVRLRQAIGSAFAQVDAQLRLRHELLAELIAAAMAELADMPEAVVAVEAARGQARVAADRAAQRATSAGRLASLALAEQVLRTALSRLVAVVKTRPALGGDPRLRELQKKLATTQTRLEAARQAFNAATLDYNRSVKQFPTRIAAAMFGFRVAGEL
jgi:LemA protein